MTKRDKENLRSRIESRSIAGILLFGIVITSLIVNPVSAAKLATPTLISPANNQQFTNKPLLTTLVCKPVTGADTYEFVIEFLSGGNTWTPWSDVTQTIPYASWYTFYFIGYQRGRWRVIAHDSSGKYTASTPSAWRTFDYSGVVSKLATPVLLSPPSNAIFYHTDPRETTLTWKAVPGATGYSIEVEYGLKDKTVITWYPWKQDIVVGPLLTYYNFHFVGHQPGRWRIKATDSTNNFQASDFSAWRKFEYTHR